MHRYSEIKKEKNQYVFLLTILLPGGETRRKSGDGALGRGGVCESGARRQRCSGSSAQGHKWADSLHDQRERTRDESFGRSKGNGGPALQGVARREVHSCKEAALQIKSLNQVKTSPLDLTVSYSHI